MPSPSKLSDAATIARAVLGYAPPPSYAAVRRMRESVPTAEFDRVTGEVVGRGRRYKRYGIGESAREAEEAAKFGREVMGMPDTLGAHRYISGAAYPKGDPSTRRHELFHGMVSQEYFQPGYMRGVRPQEIPSVAAIAAARELAGDNKFLQGAAMLAEEVAAASVGARRPMSLREVRDIAGTYADVWKDRGKMYAAPARMTQYGLLPLADPQSATATALLGGVSVVTGNAISDAINRATAEQDPRQEAGLTTDELISLLGQQ